MRPPISNSQAQQALPINPRRGRWFVSANGSAARCRHDDHDAFAYDFADSLHKFMGNQLWRGIRIKDLKLRSAEEALREPLLPNS